MFWLTDTRGANSPRRQGGQVEGAWRFVSVMKKELGKWSGQLSRITRLYFIYQIRASTMKCSLIAVLLKEHLHPKSRGTADDISPQRLWSSPAAHHEFLSFSIDISGSHLPRNTGLRRKSGAAEVVRGNKALQAANVLCCFSYSEQMVEEAWGC